MDDIFAITCGNVPAVVGFEIGCCEREVRDVAAGCFNGAQNGLRLEIIAHRAAHGKALAQKFDNDVLGDEACRSRDEDQVFAHVNPPSRKYRPDSGKSSLGWLGG